MISEPPSKTHGLRDILAQVRVRHLQVRLGRSQRKRLVVHDYAGHPFQVQLSRVLARRGHQVVHQFCSSYVSGRGAVAKLPDDPPTLRIEALELGVEFDRYSPARRVRQEVAYGCLAVERITASRPQCTIVSNVPLLAHGVVTLGLRHARVPMVFWHQDVYSAAIGQQARIRLGAAGKPVGYAADRLEKWIARRSTRVVAISDHFSSVYDRWGIDPRRIQVIPNWAELDAVQPIPKDNPWSRRHALQERAVLLYAGTLGLKHDAQLLVRLAEMGESADFTLVVASQGAGRDFLEQQKERLGLPQLLLVDYQPYEDLAPMLGAADIAVVLLEELASGYSVPSKTLTYLAAGLPVLALMPQDNPAARILRETGSGVVLTSPTVSGLTEAVVGLLGDAKVRSRMAENARRYAEETFDIDGIADRFEALLAYV